MDITEDVYGLHASSHANEGIATGLGLDYDIFCNDSSQGFLDNEQNTGTPNSYTLDQSEQVHVNAGYVNHEGRDVMFCPEQKYEAVGQYSVEPINIPRAKQPEPLTLTPPRSVGSDSPMDDQGIAINMGTESTIDVAKFSSLFGSHSLLSNGLEDSTSAYMAPSSREPEPRRKRRKTEPDCPVGIATIKTEPINLNDDVFIDTDSSTSSLSYDMPSPDNDVTSYQCLKWSLFKQNQWHCFYDDNHDIVSMVDFHVDADKGFNFSFADDSFVCQKKNHFQITVTFRSESSPKYIKVKDNFKPIEKFKIHLFGVKVESTNSTINIEQSQADRSKRPYEPVTVPVPSQDSSRITIGRLHFSETTSNNMRKKGKPNPDQRYFMLAVALHAHSKNDSQMIYASVSDRIIVRASNPGQFENDVEVVWSRGHTADSVFRVGRVGINTDRPCESLSVHGNVRVTGRIMMPSDKRIKENLTEVDSSEQLRNVSKMKLYRYSYSQEYLDMAGVNTDLDTGVIAQEVREVLPDAVKESEDLRLPDGKKIEKFLVVNKERIFMENVGAVKELCKLTDKLEIRIDELEKVSKKLQSRRRADTVSSCYSSISMSRSSFSRTSSTRSKAEHSSQNVKKSSCHGNRSGNHNSQQRCHQQVILEEPSLCSPRLMQFVIVTLVLVMSLSVGAMAALYIMQDTNRPGLQGDASEAFGTGRQNITSTTPTGTHSSTHISSTLSTRSPTKIPGLQSTLSLPVNTHSEGGLVTTPHDNKTARSNTSSERKPDHDVIPTENTASPAQPITNKPACRCCSQAEVCDSVPYSLLANKPVYFEMSNALPASKNVPSSVSLRILERNYHLKCDICGLSNASYYIPVSSSVPFQPITVEINSTSDTKVLMCSSDYYQQCPEKSNQPLYDTTITKDSWKKSHRWRLPSAFYFSSSFRFRVVKRPSSPNTVSVTCSTPSRAPQTLYKDYYIRFIRVCKI